jgi:hypothetical protein
VGLIENRKKTHQNYLCDPQYPSNLSGGLAEWSLRRTSTLRIADPVGSSPVEAIVSLSKKPYINYVLF